MFYGHVLEEDLRVFTSCKKEDGELKSCQMEQSLGNSERGWDQVGEFYIFKKNTHLCTGGKWGGHIQIFKKQFK